MKPFHLNNLAISVEKQGPTRISKASFPLRYGRYSEIITSEYEFLFNLNGEIKFIRGLNTSWPHPAEQLKRTAGNDWVYYTVGDRSGNNGINSWLGEYYLPCLPYPSNSIWEINYLSDPRIMNAIAAWAQLYSNLCVSTRDGLYTKAKELIERIIENHDGVLYERARMLNQIIGEKVSVLPPDTRHVDYEIIPLIIADGCLYHCNFCCVKSASNFQPRSRFNIMKQIGELKAFYGRNIENYSGLFLGNHDALAAGEALICDSASEAYSAFGLGRYGDITPSLFLFGSVHSLLKSGNGLFEKLNQLPFYTYINIGMESNDTPTLAYIGKPLDESSVCEAFKRMLDINATYKNIEVTANFLIGKGLSDEHYQSLKTLLRDTSVAAQGKGTIYLSPLKDSPKKRELLPLINKLQEQSKMSVYIYLIQRL
ncbi:radical SAM domain protein [Desulfocucumis palustris]|uniref:Radical SAM domain protein n=1 Tax=Desulfocucumis palustris TaxID=1898651 RepID=A0A2L2XF79_9FIRM|nr:radical SAM protein [Desulfocucumis palustris]GBF34810.1 radical SAM domain protein [Desulfocucumis palustris]